MRTGEQVDFDVVVVGASLAGCATATLLGRAGARVALIERRPDPAAFKRICTHYIQSSAVPTLERLGLLGPIEAAGGRRSRARIWTRWGWIEPPDDSRWPAGVNIRREVLDPMVRRHAAETPGVELMLGLAARDVVAEDGRIAGVEAAGPDGDARTLRARLVVAADGRDSQMAQIADVPVRTKPHGRFVYGAYFEGPELHGAPDASLWFLDPQGAAAFPTDGGRTFYACMLTKDRLPAFREDRERALVEFVSSLPEAPPILESRRVSQVLGKLDMPNVHRARVSRGMALVGDAAMAADPLWGVGCGWALQSAEWLADSVAPALRGEAALDEALDGYKRRFARALGGHARMMDGYSTGRRFDVVERALFSTAAVDERAARVIEGFGTRNIGPERLFTPPLVRALVANGARRLRARVSARRLTPPAPPPVAV